MWIFTNNSFLSIVAHRDKPEILLVRARRLGEIESVFPDADVFEMLSADYLYRAEIPREQVAEIMAKQIQEIDYDNFKNSVTDTARHDAYTAIWSVMYQYQSPALNIKKHGR